MTRDYVKRLAGLAASLSESSYDAVALSPGACLDYFIGVPLHLMERPILVIFDQSGRVFAIVPELEAIKFESALFDVTVIAYGEEPQTWGNAFEQAAHDLNLADKTVAVDSLGLRLFEYNFLTNAAPAVKIVPDLNFIARQRLHKSEAEVDLMRKAVAVAEAALTETITGIATGMTEKQLSNLLVLQLIEAGSDPNLPFDPIVSFGENSANPHAAPSDRMLRDGDVILIDWGARLEGYFSDLTRVFSWGEPAPEVSKIAELVRKANRAAFDKVRPGAAASSVDQAARSIIEDAGYGRHFNHRTGHGLGMEVHEAPFIRSDNTQVLEAGMAFTIEPGIYLPGMAGVRVEDDVVVTSSGAECLSTLPREIRDLKDS